MKKYKLKSNTLYTIYRAIGLDLLFFATYYSKFFVDVKGFENSQINIMIMVAGIIYMLIEPIGSVLIKKIGNTAAMRFGNLLWLVALALMAFPKSQPLIYVGFTLYQLAFLLKVVEPIILRNNLKIENRESDFSSVEGRTHVIYSVMTTFILLFTGFMYEWNYYSIVYACFIMLIINIILSFIIKEEKIQDEENNIIKDSQIKKEKFSIKKFFVSKLAVIIFLGAFLHYGVISNILSNFSLLLSQETLPNPVITTCIVFGRISRMIASWLYSRVYKTLKNKMAIILPVTLLICLLSFYLVGWLVTPKILRVVLFTIIIVVCYTVYDPYVLYIQDTIFTYIDEDKRQEAVATNSMFYRFGSVLVSLILALGLKTSGQVQYIALGLLVIPMVISIVFSLVLYDKLSKIDNSKNTISNKKSIRR